MPIGRWCCRDSAGSASRVRGHVWLAGQRCGLADRSCTDAIAGKPAPPSVAIPRWCRQARSSVAAAVFSWSGGMTALWVGPAGPIAAQGPLLHGPCWPAATVGVGAAPVPRLGLKGPQRSQRIRPCLKARQGFRTNARTHTQANLLPPTADAPKQVTVVPSHRTSFRQDHNGSHQMRGPVRLCAVAGLLPRHPQHLSPWKGGASTTAA